MCAAVKYFEKSLRGQEEREVFRKIKKVHKEIYNIHIYFQRAKEIYFLDFYKDSNAKLFFFWYQT